VVVFKTQGFTPTDLNQTNKPGNPNVERKLTGKILGQTEGPQDLAIMFQPRGLQGWSVGVTRRVLAGEGPA